MAVGSAGWVRVEALAWGQQLKRSLSTKGQGKDTVKGQAGGQPLEDMRAGVKAGLLMRRAIHLLSAHPPLLWPPPRPG